MRYCTKCVLPDTHEAISFDDQGVCNICRNAEAKHTKINRDERARMLHEIVEKYRDKGPYDCFIPFSDGKGSPFQLWRDYCKYVKRGHGRTNHLTCIDIRNGELDHETGLKMAQEYDGKRPASLVYFLDILGITEDEFTQYLAQNESYDWGFHKETIKKGEPLHDMKDWDYTLLKGEKNVA